MLKVRLLGCDYLLTFMGVQTLVFLLQEERDGKHVLFRWFRLHIGLVPKLNRGKLNNSMGEFDQEEFYLSFDFWIMQWLPNLVPKILWHCSKFANHGIILSFSKKGGVNCFGHFMLFTTTCNSHFFFSFLFLFINIL